MALLLPPPRDILVAHVIRRIAPLGHGPTMRDKRLPDIAPLGLAGSKKALVTIPLAANAVSFPTSYGRRQFGCGAEPTGSSLAGAVFACLLS